MTFNSTQTTQTQCTLHYKCICMDVCFASVSQTIASYPDAAILGGNTSNTSHNRYSIFAHSPIDVFTFSHDKSQSPFDGLQQALYAYCLQKAPHSLPADMFKCGWIGHFSYDLDTYIEPFRKTAVDDLNIPLIRLSFYDKAICYDHLDNMWYLIALEMETDTQSVDDKLSELESCLHQACSKTFHTNFSRSSGYNMNTITCNITREYYFEALSKIKQYIYDGDVYQINFSQRFQSEFSKSGIELFSWQNHFNPSPYAAYLKSNDYEIVSASPELFLSVTDNIIQTRPIKGTRARMTDCSDSEAVNQRHINELLNSEKEQAELNMIIDLERNDLTRICKYGTIQVVEPRTIEAYPTVFHALATIQGHLHKPMDAGMFCRILKGMFPGGSITGAPKIRAMHIIDELEPTQRSVYTGSIGFISVDNTVCLNIAIRTIIIKGSIAYAQTGGGIVADSEPIAEWQETWVKAKALLEGITAVEESK